MFPVKPIKFDGPAFYRIIVQGVLPEIDYPYFNDMKIVVEKKNRKGKGSTTITGTVTDQAALAGILNTLYDFHLSILLVEYIDESGKINL
jgi:hypothetical protein